MAGNMESMLLGDDSSSDDSDNETLEEVTIGTAVPAAAAVAATVKPQQPPAPVPAPAPATAPPPVNTATMSQSELSNRLKSLYSPANKASASAPAAPAQQQHQQQQQQQMPAPAPNMQKMERRDAMLLQPYHPQQAQQRQQQRPRSEMPSTSQPSQQSQSSSAPGFRPLVPNRPSTSSGSSSQQQQMHPSSSTATAPDPFEPTPLQAMIQRQQQKSASAPPPLQQQQQQMPMPASRAPSTGMPQQPAVVQNVSGNSNNSASSAAASNAVALSARAKMERDAKHRKERFLMFTRVLMKYLEQKDPPMHTQAKAVIRECAERNKKKEAGYESVTASMQTRLKEMVGEAYWSRAEAYLNHFLRQKEKMESQKKSQSGSSSASQSPTGTADTTQTSQQLEQKKRDSELAARKMIEIDRENKAKKALLLKQAKEAEKRKRIEAQQKQVQLAQQKAAHASKMQQIQKETAAKMAAMKASEAAKKAKSGHRRKGSTGSAASAAAASRTASPMPVAPEIKIEKAPPREYSELMELVDHAVDYNWTTAALLLGKEAKADINLNDEQKKLLYGEKAIPPKQGLQAAQIASGSAIPPYMKGWSKRNVLSSRAAWARVRLTEQKLAREAALANSKKAPVVAGLTLPLSPPETAAAEVAPTISKEAAWFNEEKAEEDKTLALLSEATNIYLKSILEKALTAARQRQNLDGIRLWHLQHLPAKPPMSIRLGCDVNRQVSQAAGNAAKTVQRMEEALERQTDVPPQVRDLSNDETLYEASSMADLALRPMLANAAEQADLDGKRSFEVYGGKDSGAAPFGRVPKKPKIVGRDFILAKEWAGYSPHIL